MKLKKNLMLSFLCIILMNTQCSDDDVTILTDCSEVIIDNNAYETAESDYYSVVNIVFNGDCLTLDLSASGCDGNTWEFTLIDSGNIAESMPPQRYLKLSLFNNEACLAVFSREESFDLTPLRVDGTNEVLLNIEGFEEPILYAY
ncbi:hypothetical protein [Winogradskyella schleiferi]|uniref:hypothetical protein n=1 Tax=Winogradskyella schleiferi TaxID=2686078 RepID=UPI0015BA6597|nr:hypothetical protein [Winogradskyella schleiferi]